MAPLGIWLEMEVGITGGEEDRVDNTGVDNASLYTQPADVGDVYKALNPTPRFGYQALETSHNSSHLKPFMTPLTKILIATSTREYIIRLHGPPSVGKTAMALEIARQEKLGNPDVKTQITHILNERPGLPKKRIEEQFEYLFVQPFAAMKKVTSAERPSCLVVIIDDIDECADIGLQRRILKILDRRVPLQFIVFSRPDAHIQDICNPIRKREEGLKEEGRKLNQRVEEISKKEKEARKWEKEARLKEDEANVRELEVGRKEREILRREAEAKQMEARRKELAIEYPEEEAGRLEEQAHRREEEIKMKEEELNRREDEILHLAKEMRQKAEEIKRQEEELMKRKEELERRELESRLEEKEAKRKQAEAQRLEEEARRKEEEDVEQLFKLAGRRHHLTTSMPVWDLKLETERMRSPGAEKYHTQLELERQQRKWAMGQPIDDQWKEILLREQSNILNLSSR
ncbi:hypothetical protein JOM56_011943 [Amanita muscaria]